MESNLNPSAFSKQRKASTVSYRLSVRAVVRKPRYIIHLEPLFGGKVVTLHSSTHSERDILNMFGYCGFHKGGRAVRLVSVCLGVPTCGGHRLSMPLPIRVVLYHGSRESGWRTRWHLRGCSVSPSTYQGNPKWTGNFPMEGLSQGETTEPGFHSATVCDPFHSWLGFFLSFIYSLYSHKLYLEFSIRSGLCSFIKSFYFWDSQQGEWGFAGTKDQRVFLGGAFKCF